MSDNLINPEFHEDREFIPQYFTIGRAMFGVAFATCFFVPMLLALLVAGTYFFYPIAYVATQSGDKEPRRLTREIFILILVNYPFLMCGPFLIPGPLGDLPYYSIVVIAGWFLLPVLLLGVLLIVSPAESQPRRSQT